MSFLTRGESMLEKHAIASYSSKPLAHPPSLSVYELPTATYMWPRFSPKGEEPPSLYMYRRTQREPERPGSSSSASVGDSSGPEPHSSTRASTPNCTWSRKRSSSVESDETPPSPSDRFLKRPRSSCHAPTPSLSHERSPTAHVSSEAINSSLHPAERDLQLTFHTLGIESDGNDTDFATRDVSPAGYHSNAAGATPPRTAPPAAVNAYTAGQASADRDDPKRREWMKYTWPHPESDYHGQEYKCIWKVALPDGTTQDCRYEAKKHLVKRHIESKHLQFRPCVCPYCDKRFAQKSNLNTHINTHTGMTPHKCLAEGCPREFKDPARRHRHMKDAHNHESSRTKKGRAMLRMAKLASSSVQSQC
ncbi:hypothetical protein BD413DRAFT_256026 [Trametes elegans]|nr:hypothetical protein BD413DRAFT_256026 [Trametes elegans]